MKRQEKGFPRGNPEMLKAVPATTATKKKGKARIGKQRQQGREDVGKKLKIEEKRDDNGGEFAERSLKKEAEDQGGLTQQALDYWDVDDDHDCFLCAVVEQISWGTSGWSTPFWDMGLMSSVEACHHRHQHHSFCSEVFWDDCIWDLNDFKDGFNSPS